MIKAFLYRLDDRVKVWMTVSAGATAIFCVDWSIQVLILSLCLGLCLASGAKRFAAGFVLLLMLMGVVPLALRLFTTEPTRTGTGFYLLLIKFGPMVAMMGFIQASLNSSRFLHLLERMRLPSRYVIPLGVCLRFMPSVASEIRQVRYAMRMRGIRFFSPAAIRGPFRMLGYIMVPILVRSLAIGEELARSAIARGIESPGPKTSIHELSFRTLDGVVLTAWTLLFAALVITDNHLYAEGIPGLRALLSGRPPC